MSPKYVRSACHPQVERFDRPMLPPGRDRADAIAVGERRDQILSLRLTSPSKVQAIEQAVEHFYSPCLHNLLKSNQIWRDAQFQRRVS